MTTAKLIGRISGLVFLAAGFVAANAGHDLGGVQAMTAGEPGPVAPVAADVDTGRLARAHLDRLYSSRESSSNRAATAIRIVLDDATEVWVAPTDAANGVYAGRLRDAVEGHERGTVVTFGADQVRDWIFFGRTGRMYGNFAARAALPGMAPRDAALVRTVLSEEAVPATWTDAQS